MKILLTGATGFIGSNIAKSLLKRGDVVYATHRTNSIFEKCILFKDNINWINTDISGWKDQIKSIQVEQLIHVAWEGIEAEHRNNWDIQIRNFWLSKEYFDLAKDCDIIKVIALGSQAEYGAYSFPVNETTLPVPYDAYGALKTLTANYLRNLFENTNTSWYWIRIFSVFGEGENSNWLLPTVISKLLKNESIPLTSCEQEYNYLYIEDFLKQFLAIVQCNQNKSGIYNLCNAKTISLKDLLLELADLMNASKNLLHFDSIPQRPGQNMLIAGDNSKFRNSFSKKNDVSFELTNGLIKTIEYHKKMKS